MGLSSSANVVGQHTFVARLLQHVDLDAADLKRLGEIIDGELIIRRRRDLIVDGYEYRKLCFVKDGYAVRIFSRRNWRRSRCRKPPDHVQTKRGMGPRCGVLRSPRSTNVSSR
jgi:hypothetical protein